MDRGQVCRSLLVFVFSVFWARRAAASFSSYFTEAGGGCSAPRRGCPPRFVAEHNLKLGRWVVADCLNPIATTRDAWRDVAVQEGARLLGIEVRCSGAQNRADALKTAQSTSQD